MREQAGRYKPVSRKNIMNTNGSVYPRWEREGGVSRFFIGPSLSVYQVEEIELIGGINVRDVCVGKGGTEALGSNEQVMSAPATTGTTDASPTTSSTYTRGSNCVMLWCGQRFGSSGFRA